MPTTADDPYRVVWRLLDFQFLLMERVGIDLTTLPPALAALRAPTAATWVRWSTYLAAINHLVAQGGGTSVIGRALRAAVPDGYTELRAMHPLFPDPLAFFSFVCENIMAETLPCVSIQVERLSDHRSRLTTHIPREIEGSEAFHCGTIGLTEVFPTHAGLAEARVEHVTLSPHHCVFECEFPGRSNVGPTNGVLPRGVAEHLTPREREVLALVTEGLTNAEVAARLNTAPSTVKNQVSSILAKLGARTRTELAVRATRS